MFGPISELLHGADIHIRRALTWKTDKTFTERRTLTCLTTSFYIKDIYTLIMTENKTLATPFQ